MMHTKLAALILASFFASLVMNTVCADGDSSSADKDDGPKNYTCLTNVEDDDDCEVAAFFEGKRYCCEDDDDAISFTLDFAHSSVDSGSLSKRIEGIVQCTCLEPEERDLGDKISDAIDDVKDTVGERWEDAKDWAKDLF